MQSRFVRLDGSTLQVRPRDAAGRFTTWQVLERTDAGNNIGRHCDVARTVAPATTGRRWLVIGAARHDLTFTLMHTDTGQVVVTDRVGNLY